MGFSRWVHIDDCDILGETDKAFKVGIPDGDEFTEVWIPKSQISDPDELTVGDTGVTVSVSEWFADKEGLGPQ